MAIRHLHLEYTFAGERNDARGLRRLQLIMEQNTPLLRHAVNDDGPLHNWMGVVDLVGLESSLEEREGRE